MELVKTSNAKPIEATPLPDLPCCGNCPFWFEREDLHATKAGGYNGGDCRLNPPVSFLMMVETITGPQAAFNSVWPTLAADRWCSKHPERDAEARTAVVVNLLDNLREDSPAFKKLMENAGLTSP